MAKIGEFTAVFLVGGKGTRLGLGKKPKPLVDIEGVPLLERMIFNFKSQGIKNFIMLCGFGSDQIAQHLNQQKFSGLNIEIIIEKTPLGTAGSFSLIENLVTNKFIVVYGDLLFEVDLERFINFGIKKIA